ncbi:MAG: hypothetical protein ACRDTD_17185, partial [Pseudonocardiaceae bacterium]
EGGGRSAAGSRAAHEACVRAFRGAAVSPAAASGPPCPAADLGSAQKLNVVPDQGARKRPGPVPDVLRRARPVGVERRSACRMGQAATHVRALLMC